MTKDKIQGNKDSSLNVVYSSFLPPFNLNFHSGPTKPLEAL